MRRTKSKGANQRNDRLGIADGAVQCPFMRLLEGHPMHLDDLRVFVSRRARLNPGGLEQVQNFTEDPR